MQGHFHAHITVEADPDSFQCPHLWKKTVIHLKKDGRVQTDVMITRHFMVGADKKFAHLGEVMSECDNAADQLGVQGHKVVRSKLEHEDLPTVVPSKTNYRECHIKIKKPVDVDLISADGFVESISNIGAQVKDGYVISFLNARFYEGTVEFVDACIDATVEKLKKLNPFCSVVGVKKESAIIDTNPTIDEWWA